VPKGHRFRVFRSNKNDVNAVIEEFKRI